jgi:sugar/nucleoside kinase (ribokinase family)
VSKPRPLSALLVGAISRDLWSAESGLESSTPGGVVHHAGLALANLGLEVHVVTRVHPRDRAELLAPLERAGVRVHALPSLETTTYRNDYTGEGDAHALLACSDPILPDDVPPHWRSANFAQLGPLHPDDVMPELASELSTLVGIDAQGLVRTRSGTLERSPRLDAILPHVHVLQVSESELASVLGGATAEEFAARGAVAEWIITYGARGARVRAGGSWADIPARPAQPCDARAKAGAGDVFLASYLWQRASGVAPDAAARSAAALCAIKLTRGGIPAGLDVKEFAA